MTFALLLFKRQTYMPGFQMIIGKECTTHFEYLYIEIFLETRNGVQWLPHYMNLKVYLQTLTAKM